MKALDNYYAFPSTPFIINILTEGDITYFVCADTMNQIVSCVALNPDFKDTCMSHMEIEVNKNLNFLMLFTAVKKLKDVLETIDTNLDICFESLEKGVTYKDSNGFMQLHTKPLRVCGIYMDNKAHKHFDVEMHNFANAVIEKHKSYMDGIRHHNGYWKYSPDDCKHMVSYGSVFSIDQSHHPIYNAIVPEMLEFRDLIAKDYGEHILTKDAACLMASVTCYCTDYDSVSDKRFGWEHRDDFMY